MKHLLLKSVGLSFCLLLLSAGLAFAQGSADFTLTASNVGDDFGASVDGIGDVNNDGSDDFVIGATGASNGRGTISVFSGVNQNVLFVAAGDLPGDRLGATASIAGDVNGDGVVDFMAGAPFGTNLGITPGYVRIYSGADGSTLHTLFGTTDAGRFGSAICPVGDLNGDGYDDVLIGAADDNTNVIRGGSAKIFSGIDGSILMSWFGTTENDALGAVVANVGDVTGDGKSDFAIGTPGFSPPNNSARGRFQIFSGADASVFRSHLTPFSVSFLGPITDAGDFNGDGVGDYMMNFGVPLFSTMSVVQVISGLTGFPLFSRSSIFTQFGRAMDGGGDLNNDGYDDVLIASRTPLGVRNVSLYSGLTGDILFTVEGTSDFGAAVKIVGDTNGDSVPDVIITRPDFNSNATSGDAFGYFGFDGFLNRVVPYNSGPVPGGSTNDLVLSWAPDGGMPEATTGTLTVSGATPGGLGRYGVSLAPIQFNLIGFGIVLLIANDPINLIGTGDFGFDFNGELVVPNVNLQSPFIPNALLYVQFFEFSPFIQASNGLRMIVSP